MPCTRKARGLTHQKLADRLGTSRRMVAYYEGPDRRPPAHVLDKLAPALKVSADCYRRGLLHPQRHGGRAHAQRRCLK
jgi:transcriptional regulator with XRE-family HTH domain